MSVGKTSIVIMKISGYLFFSVGIIVSILGVLIIIGTIGAFIGTIGAFIGTIGAFSLFMSIINTAILALATLILGITMVTLGPYTPEAKVTSVLLFTYLALDILSAAVLLYDQTLGIVAKVVVVLLIRIYAFNMVNKTFRKLDPSLRSPIFPIYGWFGIITLTSTIIRTSSDNWGLIKNFEIFVAVGILGLLIGMGIILLQNSKILPNISVRALEEKLPLKDRIYTFFVGGSLGAAVAFGYVLSSAGVIMGFLYLIKLLHQAIVGV